MNADVKRVVSSPLVIRPVAGFLKQQVDSSIEDCRLKQLHAETGKDNEKEVPVPPSRSPSAATENSDTRSNAKTPNIEEVRNKNAHCECLDHQKCQRRAKRLTSRTSSSSWSRSPRRRDRSLH